MPHDTGLAILAKATVIKGAGNHTFPLERDNDRMRPLDIYIFDRSKSPVRALNSYTTKSNLVYDCYQAKNRLDHLPSDGFRGNPAVGRLMK